MVKNLLNVPDYNLILIDAMNYAYISYYGRKNLSWKGKPTGMIFGVMSLYFKLRLRYPRARIIFIWEGTRNRRKDISEDYKSGRTKKTDDFKESLKEIRLALKKVDVDQMWHVGLEADDLAGYLTTQAKDKEKVLLISNDEDWMQYMKPNVDLYRKGMAESYEDIKTILGFPPEKMGMWKMLKSDTSDGVKGIKRMPSDVAVCLITNCSNYRQLKKYNLKKHNPSWESWTKKIQDEWPRLEKNAELLLYHSDWIREEDIMCVHGKILPKTALKRFLNSYGMTSLSKRVDRL